MAGLGRGRGYRLEGGEGEGYARLRWQKLAAGRICRDHLPLPPVGLGENLKQAERMIEYPQRGPVPGSCLV